MIRQEVEEAGDSDEEEKIRGVVAEMGNLTMEARLAECVANSSTPWSAYCSLLACHLVVFDKRPGVRPVGIGETLHRYLAKLVMRADGEQENTACSNLQLFPVLEAGIEGYAHTV